MLSRPQLREAAERHFSTQWTATRDTSRCSQIWEKVRFHWHVAAILEVAEKAEKGDWVAWQVSNSGFGLQSRGQA